ncbi:MAG TPA: hypothetical protein VN812_01625, partial [Candidatus Acidoferrales bacterium]|nr:hypothetical protein [Candidatus Acidoferrales bacterium]
MKRVALILRNGTIQELWQRTRWRVSLVCAVLTIGLMLPVDPAHAVPSFARQTGLACSSCHTTFPELNAFGRAFKMHGYTTLAMKELEEAGT